VLTSSRKVDECKPLMAGAVGAAPPAARGFAEAVSDAVHEGISCAVLATGIHGCGKSTLMRGTAGAAAASAGAREIADMVGR